MFGFLHGPRSNKTYRQIYASCCSSLRDRFGYRSLPFVSYEAIFAHSLAVDRGLIKTPDTDAVVCCKTRRTVSPLRHVDDARTRAAFEFSAAFAMLLASVKLSDDVNDSGSISARLMRRWLRRPIQGSTDYFVALDSDFQSRLQERLDDHAAMERETATPSLNRYTSPTGDAFALVFGLLPVAIARAQGRDVDEAEHSLFESVGRLVGRSLIAFDCAVDFKTDRKRGHYNPLSNSDDVVAAFDDSQRQLIRLGWLLGDTMHSDSSADASMIESICSSVLQQRIQSIGRYRKSIVDELKSSKRFRSTGRGLGFLTPLRMQRGECDCDCLCGLCEGCGTGGGHLLECCSGSGGKLNCCGDCCCDAVCSSCSSPFDSTEKPKPAVANETTDAGPRYAEVVVALTPYGTVRLLGDSKPASRSGTEPGVRVAVIDKFEKSDSTGREEPAKSDVGVIEVGQRVEVIRKDSFGLLVRPASEKSEAKREP